MANKAKIGLDYFPLETSFFGDIKIRKLIKYQSCKAVPVYTLLLCNIYEKGYYVRWDNELPFILSETTGYEEGYVDEVIICCLNIGLFSKKMFEESKVLTSKGIQERYQEICRILKRKSIISEYSLINSEELGNNSEELIISVEEKTQSKVKESKGKEIKVNYKFRLREKIYEINVSDFLKSNYQSFLESWQMKNKEPNISEIFERIDSDYLSYNFTNENHILNSFRSTAMKILKEKSSGKKESEAPKSKFEKIQDLHEKVQQQIRDEYAANH